MAGFEVSAYEFDVERVGNVLALNVTSDSQAVQGGVLQVLGSSKVVMAGIGRKGGSYSGFARYVSG